MGWIRKNSPFKSVNNEIVMTIKPAGKIKKYLTGSGVGRLAAIQSVFPKGVKIKVDVGTIPYSLEKRLVAINSLFIYSKRFDNLKKYNIHVKEIIYKRKRKRTAKRYNRKRFLKTRKKNLGLVPWKG